jgi:endonuclease/exonuclease/phosphatase family metal-dependent hydrolase
MRRTPARTSCWDVRLLEREGPALPRRQRLSHELLLLRRRLPDQGLLPGARVLAGRLRAEGLCHQDHGDDSDGQPARPGHERSQRSHSLRPSNRLPVISRQRSSRTLLMCRRRIVVVPALLMGLVSCATFGGQSRLDIDADLIQGTFTTEGPAGGAVTLLSWNVRYGRRLDDVEAAIARETPDISLLQEVDVDARRTGYVNVAEALARSLGLNYVFGVEFEELSQRRASSPAYTGQAVLTRFPVQSVRILRFKRQTSWWQPRWYIPNWRLFQRRRGGRMALVTTLEIAGRPLVVYNVHLEGRGGHRMRLGQLEEILADVSQYPPDTPIVVAGDLNTKDRPSLLHERLIDEGFHLAAGDGDTPTQPKGRTLDWIFVRGPVRVDDGQVHQDVAASDHHPLTVRLFLNDTNTDDTDAVP